MHTDDPDAPGRWDDGRGETELQRLDRNWAHLLQELRLAQTGVQLLTGFLLLLPFSDHFDMLDGAMRMVYLATVVCSIGATILLIAPVSMHRLLFRRRRMKTLVATGHRYAVVGLLLLGFTLAGVATIIFDSVANRPAAWIAGGVSLTTLALFWFVFPLRGRMRDEH